MLLLSQSLPVLGSNGRYLSSHQVQEVILTRNIKTQIDGFRYFKRGNMREREERERVGLFCDHYHFCDDDINYAPIN